MRLRWINFLATLVAITGLAGLYFVFNQLPPTASAQVLLLALIFVTATALAIPMVSYLNLRFADAQWQEKDPNRLWRQAIEIGSLLDLLVILQLEHWLNGVTFAFVVMLFALIEIYLLAAEK